MLSLIPSYPAIGAGRQRKRARLISRCSFTSEFPLATGLLRRHSFLPTSNSWTSRFCSQPYCPPRHRRLPGLQHHRPRSLGLTERRSEVGRASEPAVHCRWNEPARSGWSCQGWQRHARSQGAAAMTVHVVMVARSGVETRRSPRRRVAPGCAAVARSLDAVVVSSAPRGGADVGRRVSLAATASLLLGRTCAERLELQVVPGDAGPAPRDVMAAASPAPVPAIYRSPHRHTPFHDLRADQDTQGAPTSSTLPSRPWDCDRVELIEELLERSIRGMDC